MNRPERSGDRRNVCALRSELIRIDIPVSTDIEMHNRRRCRCVVASSWELCWVIKQVRSGPSTVRRVICFANLPAVAVGTPTHCMFVYM